MGNADSGRSFNVRIALDVPERELSVDHEGVYRGRCRRRFAAGVVGSSSRKRSEPLRRIVHTASSEATAEIRSGRRLQRPQSASVPCGV